MSSRNTTKVSISGTAKVTHAEATGYDGNVKPPGDAKFDVSADVRDGAVVQKALATAIKVNEPTTSNPQDGNKSMSNGTTFDEETFVLMLPGTGNGKDIFKSMLDAKKKKFMKMGIKEENIIDVPLPSQWKANLRELEDAFDHIISKENIPKFIFYYCGHFGKDKVFQIGLKGKEDELLASARLVEWLKQVSCTYMLLVLDMCFSASFEADMDQGQDRDEVAFNPEDVPDLLSLLMESSMDPTEAKKKYVQWSSSKAHEPSKLNEYDQVTRFTEAFLNVFKENPGREMSVWGLNELVNGKLKHQTSEVRPSEDTFPDFPKFQIK